MFDVVTIGSSAGGIDACSRLLGMLPKGFSWPILLVQHLHHSQDASIVAEIIKARTNFSVRAARNKEIVLSGHVYIAPSDQHLVVTKKRSLSLTKHQKVKNCRPSIDVLFKSASAVFQERIIGIILTGANDDGADGLMAIKSNGGFTIAQDPKTAVVSHMPNSAIKKTYIDTVLSPEDIGRFLGEMWEVFASSPITRKRQYYDRR